MAKYSAIKAAVNAYIKANGRKEITGSILNAVLTATIDSLGRFFQFAGGALPTDNPGTPDQNVCYLAGEPGLYINFGNIRVNNEEVALLFWDGEWKKQSVLYGIQEVDASVDSGVGTPSVDVSYSGGRLVLTFHNLKGDKGDIGNPAGFGNIGADVTNSVGTPGVSVETSGSNVAKNIMFHFTNLKGDPGVSSVIATIDDTSGLPTCRVSLIDGVLTLAFSGLKGLKGDTGVSADYPITIYNGLDSDATDQALAAEQGKILNGKINQLGKIVNGQEEGEETLVAVSVTSKSLVSPTDNTLIQVSSATWKVCEFDIEGGETYVLAGRTYSGQGCLYSFLDANGDFISSGVPATSSARARSNVVVVAPANATKLRVGGNDLYDYYGSAVHQIPAMPGLVGQMADLQASMTALETQAIEQISEINNLDYVLEPEFIDSTAITEELIIQNGAEMPLPGLQKSTALLPYSSKNKYVYSGYLDNFDLSPAAYYDARKQLIGTDSILSGMVQDRELTNIPTGTAFIRFCVWAVDERFKVEITSAISDLVDNMPYDPKENTAVLDFTPGNVSQIVSDFDANNNLLLQFNLLRNGGTGNNPGFNFLYAKTKNKTNGVETLVHDCQDDICPTDFGGQYIGANHAGYGRMLITSNAHGKTYADIGSVWSDGSHNFVIVGIVDENRLYLLGENTAEYPLFSFAQADSNATFTHVSGATHTDSFTSTGKTIAQWWPAFAIPATKVYLDGMEVSESGTYKFAEMVISEVYDVINPASALEVLKQNAGTYTDNPRPGDLSNADKYSRHTITYTFRGADKCMVATSITAFQDLGAGYFGFTQQAKLEGDTIRLYVPSVHSVDGENIDLRLPVVLDASIAGKVIKKSDCDNPLRPADRWLQYSGLVGFYAGYLFDYGVGGDNRANVLESGVIHISNASKMYPRGIGIPMDALDNYSAVCFRNYLPVGGLNTGGFIAKNLFEYKGALYIYADFRSAKLFEIEIPVEYQGRQVEVYDKSDNVTLLTQNAANTILVNVAASNPMTGYIVAKIG